MISLPLEAEPWTAHRTAKAYNYGEYYSLDYRYISMAPTVDPIRFPRFPVRYPPRNAMRDFGWGSARHQRERSK